MSSTTQSMHNSHELQNSAQLIDYEVLALHYLLIRSSIRAVAIWSHQPFPPNSQVLGGLWLADKLARFAFVCRKSTL